MLRVAGLLLALLVVTAAARLDAAPFEFQTGDRVVFLGNTLIEREQSYGYWELALTLAEPEKKLTFRNVGWSGDSVWCESRGIFDQPQQGYQRTLELVKELKPTVIILGYGGNEAFAGPTGVDAFLQQYRKLLDDLKDTKARLVFLSPLPLEKLGASYPDPAAYNQNVETYSKAIAGLAEERGGQFVALSRPPATVSDAEGKPQMTTDNGQHYTEWGYWTTANQLRDALAPGGKKVDLPMPSAADLKDLPAGKPGEVEAIRRLIVRKGELYFHRWRPQNVTYLFLFRKHEQGNNAVEIPQFDPLIEKLEGQIHEAALKLK
jgi:lysophospholipase L1-like esterase